MHGKVFTLALLLIVGMAARASAQECPRSSPRGTDAASQARRLTGHLVFHDGIRRWFELKLDRQQCGKGSVQVTVPDHQWKPLQTLRGCRVETYGSIDFSPTGYYSLDLYQHATKVTPAGTCARKSPLPDYSNALPDGHVRAYAVDMRVDYRPGDHPIVFRVRSGTRELHPWQAYASYTLTGGFVLYGSCGKGFVVDKVYGPPEAHPSHFDDAREPGDMAAFDPESAAESGRTDLHLGYTCVRGRSG